MTYQRLLPMALWITLIGGAFASHDRLYAYAPTLIVLGTWAQLPRIQLQSAYR